MGYFDLRRCITDKVELAPREMCARLNTFLMVTMRPTRDEDEDDLITKKHDTVVTTKYVYMLCVSSETFLTHLTTILDGETWLSTD